MVQPTDRVIAKTLAKIIGVNGTLSGNKNKVLLQLVGSLNIVVGDNLELRNATMDIILEASQELKAEVEGRASSITASPVALPWYENAGSGE